MANRVTIHLTNDTKDTDHRDPKNSLKRVFKDATIKIGNGFLEVSWTEAGCIVSRGWPASGISFFEQEYR